MSSKLLIPEEWIVLYNAQLDKWLGIYNKNSTETAYHWCEGGDNNRVSMPLRRLIDEIMLQYGAGDLIKLTDVYKNTLVLFSIEDSFEDNYFHGIRLDRDFLEDYMVQTSKK